MVTVETSLRVSLGNATGSHDGPVRVNNLIRPTGARDKRDPLGRRVVSKLFCRKAYARKRMVKQRAMDVCCTSSQHRAAFAILN